MIEISYLKTILTNGDQPSLFQAKIDAWESFASFDEFTPAFLAEARYPRPQSNKYETYSWVPTLFEPSVRSPKRPDAKPQDGVWRNGRFSAHVVTLMYLDLDNQFADRPFMDIDTVEAKLRELGLSHLLYTSFSHKTEHPKFRVIMPIDRVVTYLEASLMFLWFNWLFGCQLDGSIYDDGDHLYGPPYEGEVRQWTSGVPIAVDAILASVEGLPDEALAFANLRKSYDPPAPLTPEQAAATWARIADTSARNNLSISNPAFFNPAWMDDLTSLYLAGSHSQSLLGLASRIWLKSRATLSLGDMTTLYHEMDSLHGGYCRRKYGHTAIRRDLQSVMHLQPSEPPTHPHQPTQGAI